jgi:large subunit ribosomal protein L2
LAVDISRKVRLIDFKRDRFDIPAVVKSIEYDPAHELRA